MKILLLTLSLCFCVLTFSQQLIIQVDEVQSYYGDTSQTLEEVLNGQLHDDIPVPKNCRYVINTAKPSVAFYRDDVLEISSPVKITYDQDYMVIDLLEIGFDIGLIVNLTNESILLYDNRPPYVEYMKFTKCQIIKSS